ncbi:hypothetical protein, partial [Phocaeicola dorei]|uniref:hypothetical protein n=1 Tax=Phocaeicola dorei TaxID=357276 RepID=UPI0032EF0F5F
ARSNHIISFTLFKTEGKVTTKNKQRSVDFDINGMEIKEKGIEKYISPPLFLFMNEYSPRLSPNAYPRLNSQ